MSNIDANAGAGGVSGGEEVNVVDGDEEVDVEDYDEDDEDESEEENKSQLENDQDDVDDDQDIEDEGDDEDTRTAPNISFSRKSKYNFNLNENMLYQEVLQVNCNSVVAELHKKKFGSGGKGHCIRLVVRKEANDSAGSVIEEKWMTPIEFENYCGKGNCRDWKRTIKVGGQPLLALLDARILICHAVSCSCGICNRNETLVGPIRPFMKYRRRKRDEILAQNAYKKFLSLKPPTLINDTAPLSSNNNITASINNNTNSNSSLLSNSSQSSPPNLTRPTFVNESREHLIFPAHLNGGSGDLDLMSLMNKMKDQDEKKWSTLEQLANTLINQTKLLQTSIEQAKRESELNWKYLIDRASISSSKRASKKATSKRRVSSVNSINQESSM